MVFCVKVREHNRKLRKEAKKKGVSKRVKKDPGVPNSAPFKEEVLREAEQRRLQVGFTCSSNGNMAGHCF